MSTYNLQRGPIEVRTRSTNRAVYFKTYLNVVYKIPYRRAPRLACRPLGRVRRASKGILHTNFNDVYFRFYDTFIHYMFLCTRYPIVVRARAKVSYIQCMFIIKQFSYIIIEQTRGLIRDEHANTVT